MIKPSDFYVQTICRAEALGQTHLDSECICLMLLVWENLQVKIRLQMYSFKFILPEKLSRCVLLLDDFRISKTVER